MSSLHNRNQGRGISQDTLNMVLLLAAAGTAWAVFQVWGWALRADGLDDSDLLPRALRGDVTFPDTAKWALAGLAAAAFLTFTAVLAAWSRFSPSGKFYRGNGREDIDAAAEHMAKPRHFRRFTKKGRTQEAKRLRTTPEYVKLGTAVINGEDLYLGLEDTAIAEMGPRSGKTTGFAAPTIMEARGPVVATSNKRDLVDLTRGYRETLGDVWVFDPQDLIGEPCTWYWDPIGYVANGPRNKRDARARKLAHRFAFATSTQHTGGKDYFDRSAEGLISQLILAASVLDRPLLQIRDWLTHPKNWEPVIGLENAGYQMHADALRENMELNDKQRQGVYGTANTMTEFLTYETIRPWITASAKRRAFDPETFVRAPRPGTLYSISKEEMNSMGPIVAALTIAVCEAAEELAQHSPAGRLETPLRLVLDEVANVCRWDDLPNQYSHYGSKGILPFAFLQSYDQGKEVWGDNGMGKLWSASTMRIIGPGIAANGFQQSVSGMIGKFTYASHSTSYNEKGSTRSVQSGQDDILDVSDLTAIPPGRAVLVPSGSRPILLRTIPLRDRKYPKVKAREPRPDTAPIVRLDAPLTTTAPEARRTSRWVQN